MEINVETAVRICPVSYDSGDALCVQSNSCNNTVQLANARSYQVNYALPVNCCQNTVFTTTVLPLVNYLMEGCDVSIVTLGQSGTGKTYTLLGPGFHCAASEAEHGIVPRFIREVFTKMKLHSNRIWTLHMAWSLICGENVQDLLGEGTVECRNISQVFQFLQLGMSNITTKHSHTLLTITLEQQWMMDNIVQHRVSTASFVDLAGTEKTLLYDCDGTLQIVPTDLGIQALQNCIMSLSDHHYNQYSDNSCTFVPYAQSTLTLLLKDSFGGRAKTLLLCCVSPVVQDFTETLYTMQIALRAQVIKNAVTVNSYTTIGSLNENSHVFGLKFAATQLFKLVSNAEELFQRLVSNGSLPKIEQQQISQWLTLKQECEDCISENSEPHKSLERIEEEIETGYDESSNESEAAADECNKITLDNIQLLTADFRINTTNLILKANESHLAENTDSIRDSQNAFCDEYHSKDMHVRRTSIRSSEELFYQGLPLTPSKGKEDRSDSYEKKAANSPRNNTQQSVANLDHYQQQITDLEHTIKGKEKLISRYKDAKNSGQLQMERKYHKLKKDVHFKLSKAQQRRNQQLGDASKAEILLLDGKLQDPDVISENFSDDEGAHLLELESSLLMSKKQLEALKNQKPPRKKSEGLQEEENKELETSDNYDSCGNSENKLRTSDSKAMVLIRSTETLDSSTNESVEYIRHGIRALRRTRDYFLEQCSKVDLKSQSRNILNEYEERKLLQCEEAIEAIDLIIEYKNAVICGHKSLNEVHAEESGEQLLIERLLSLSENEMRLLLRTYFEKVVELRASTKRLEVLLMATDNQNDTIQNLKCALKKVRMEAERKIMSLEERLHLVLQNNEQVLPRVVGRSKHSAVTLQVGSGSKQIDNKSLLARITRYARQETVPLQAVAPAVPSAKVTRQKNKLFIQQTNK